MGHLTGVALRHTTAPRRHLFPSQMIIAGAFFGISVRALTRLGLHGATLSRKRLDVTLHGSLWLIIDYFKTLQNSYKIRRRYYVFKSVYWIRFVSDYWIFPELLITKGSRIIFNSTPWDFQLRANNLRVHKQCRFFSRRRGGSAFNIRYAAEAHIRALP